MKITRIVSILFFTLVAQILMAQPNQANAYGNRSRNEVYRRQHNCTEPFPIRSFNRDYAGLSSANIYHLEKTLKEYTRLRCLTSEQVRRLAMLFPTDREKYDYLVYSFNHVFDIENYAMTGTTLANRNAKDGFYRFLVQEGVPAGDYFTDPYVVMNDPYRYTTPQYRDRYGNIVDSRYQNNDPYAGRNTNPSDYDYNRYNNNGNNNGAGINEGYNGMLSYQEFAILMDQIRRNTFDKGRMEEAKKLTRNNRLTVNQILEITRLFTFENNRLEYAKFAYEYAYDRQNYQQVVDVMAFENSKKELRKYIERGR
jgi:Domain of unknown function (DUF4476)